ncbi:MAG TPA: hypothetical protein VGQ59_10340 [Cyclobacteriaceae bacterium]|jgi:hypothetical protein|nr:hypothetical protein [Cyclobacteriaceae bacterium]
MDKTLIPRSLHHLMPFVEKWGVEDDGFRDNLIYNSSNEELHELVDNLSDIDADNLNKWLADPEEIKQYSPEYLKYSAYYMAYEFAEALLKSKSKNNNPS